MAFTDPSKLGEQVREFESLLDKLRPGDVVRVTVNAQVASRGSKKGAGALGRAS
jgi:hypothetical protein